MDLSKLTISEFQKGLRAKEWSATEAAQTYLGAIETGDLDIKAYLRTLPESALQTAATVDQAIAAGEILEPLAGVPLALKDNILVEGEIATAGSKILENYRAAYDAHVVEKLKAARAVILGKTNLDEFAMGTSTENSAYQITRNPRDLERVPGGSSGGSAAAVAADMALGALGSDTGGSIRQPASFCGIVGLKPTYGSVSRSGLIAMASSLDQIGSLAKNVSDARLIFEAIRGYDPADATSSQQSDEPLAPFDVAEAKNLVVGWPEEYFVQGLNPQVGAAIEEARRVLEKAGVKVKSVALPHTRYALAAYYIIVPAEVSANLARFDGIRYERRTRNAERETLKDVYFRTRGEGFGPEPKRRIILGTFVLSSGYYDAYYAKAQAVRNLIRQDFNAAFRAVDVIMAPVAPNPPFKIGEKINDPLALYLEDVFTLPVNMAGLPGLALRTPVQEPLPIGFQLIGRHFREADILNLGQLYENQTAA